MIIVMASLVKTLIYESYRALGIVALVFVYIIIALTFIRFFYTVKRLFKEYTHNFTTD